MEEPQWNHQEHPGRHRLPWAHHLQEHSQACSRLDTAHHYWQTRLRWSGKPPPKWVQVANKAIGLIIKLTFGNFLATRPLFQTHLFCVYLSKNKTFCIHTFNWGFFSYSTELQTLLWTSPANSRSSSLLLTAVHPRNGRSTISPREAVEWACTTQMRWVHICSVCCNRVKGIPVKHTAVFLTQYIIKTFVNLICGQINHVFLFYPNLILHSWFNYLILPLHD